MGKKVLLPIAEGVEEIETVTLIDVLRRAGAEVSVAAIGKETTVTAARGVVLVADCLLESILEETFDLIVLPGGLPGAEHLRDCQPLMEMLHRQKQEGRLYGAICASPAVALAPHGLLADKMACCYPSFFKELPNPGLADLKVVIDGNCATSQGPGTAMRFALALVGELFGEEKKRETGRALLAE